MNNKEYLTEENSFFLILTSYLNESLCKHFNVHLGRGADNYNILVLSTAPDEQFYQNFNEIVSIWFLQMS